MDDERGVSVKVRVAGKQDAKNAIGSPQHRSVDHGRKRNGLAHKGGELGLALGHACNGNILRHLVARENTRGRHRRSNPLQRLLRPSVPFPNGRSQVADRRLALPKLLAKGEERQRGTPRALFHRFPVWVRDAPHKCPPCILGRRTQRRHLKVRKHNPRPQDLNPRLPRRPRRT